MLLKVDLLALNIDLSIQLASNNDAFIRQHQCR